MIAEVVKLDRGLPLVAAGDFSERAEYGPKLSKKHTAVAIGDKVEITDEAPYIINKILDRKTKLVRNDPVNRNKEQVLAANFDQIVVCNVCNDINENHLRRELCIARNAAVPVKLLLTKCDLNQADPEEGEARLEGPLAELFDAVYTSQRGVAPELSVCNFPGILHAKCASFPECCTPDQELFPQGTTTVLLGKSGAGKSTLINFLAGKEIAKTGDVREYDQKGRHTTVAREIYNLGNFRVIDMPGVRSLGLINCDRGIAEAFPEISTLSKNCRFRDCKHKNEPGCAVKGSVPDELLASYHELVAENEPVLY